MAHNFAATRPVQRLKSFNDDNSRLRYLTEEGYGRRLTAAKGRAAGSESGGISEGIWLAALDDFRNWLIGEAA